MLRAVTVGTVCVVLFAGGFGEAARADDSVAWNKNLVRRFTDEVYNQSHKERIDAYVHADFIDHSPGAPLNARGPAYVASQYAATYAAFPDLRFTVEDLIGEGDKVVMRWSSQGTFTGKLGDVPGKGQSMTVHGTSIFRLQDGKIIESWDLVDRLAMLRQAGFTVAPPVKTE